MTRLLLTALAVVLAAPAAFAQGTPARTAPARLAATNDSIFAPLQLPTPNAQRSADGRPGPDYWQNRNDYRIEARLDTLAHEVTGTVRLTYTNNSPEALPFLWFHLEQNLFAPGSRGSTGRRASPTVQPGQGFRIGAVTAGGQAVTPVITDTRMRVDLTTPVAANGGTVEVTIPYAFLVPGDQTPRMGRMEARQGTVYALAQWYPRVAVYDDVQGWNTMPYLGSGEFYLGYGDFEFDVTVPATMQVVGTGVVLNPDEVYTRTQRERIQRASASTSRVRIVEPTEVGTAAASPSRTGTTTWRFRAENVRDVAWGASAGFILDGATAAVRQDDGTTNEVLILSAYPAEGVSADAANPGWEEATRYGRAAILNNSRWYPYPYPVAISVASHIGGMEYPMLHFSDVTSRHTDLFGVVDHELGHNWFPMIVGNDERRYAWMDEGFNTFLNTFSQVTFYDEGTDPSLPGYGTGASSGYTAFTAGDPFVAYATRMGANDRPIMTYPDRVPGQAGGYVLYFKPAAGLRILRDEVLGAERFDDAFMTYIRRWAFKHPQPADFMRTMEDVSGEDLDWFWREWLYGTDTFDAALAGVSTIDGQAVAAIRNNAELVFPATVEFTFADGTTERASIPVEAWMSGDEAAVRVPLNGRTVRSARLDPDGRLPDTDRSNDSATL
ncbi:MAG TPA: M1 family metallopeptidase [Rubricoccaceae bacterium]